MEIIIGSSPQIGQSFPTNQPAGSSSGMVEAKLLHVRKPRKGVAGPSGMERREKKTQDPLKGRVLTLLIPDADTLPKDIDSGSYRVMLRFQKK